jgi:hypothetical protein
MPQPNLNILTIATGKKLYLDMAISLARSFWLWNSESGIKFYLATDQPDLLEEDVKGYVNIISLKPGELGFGFSPKLHLDELAPNGQTLFIDSDCLVYGDLLPVFKRFKGHEVSVIGSYIKDGEWFGNVSAICKKFEITRLPKFNGGIYYIENGPKAAAVYKAARHLEPQYDEIGFVRLRDRPNDEVLMALAMELHQQTPITDDGTITSDPLTCSGTFSTNVISGKTRLHNPPAPSTLNTPWYPFTYVKPLIVHFLGHHTHGYQYKADVFRLQAKSKNQSYQFSNIAGALTIEFPMRLRASFKNFFRPVYRAVFGVRSFKQSERL